MQIKISVFLLCFCLIFLFLTTSTSWGLFLVKGHQLDSLSFEWREQVYLNSTFQQHGNSKYFISDMKALSLDVKKHKKHHLDYSWVVGKMPQKRLLISWVRETNCPLYLKCLTSLFFRKTKWSSPREKWNRSDVWTSAVYMLTVCEAALEWMNAGLHQKPESVCTN